MPNVADEGPGAPGGWWIRIAPEPHLRPDWVCETPSPSTVRIDRGRKRAIDARAGVDHLRLVDPLAGSRST